MPFVTVTETEGNRGDGGSRALALSSLLGTVISPLLEEPSQTSEPNYFISSMSIDSYGSFFPLGINLVSIGH